MTDSKPLSKSKLIAFRQCPKRLWLEVHHPELRQDSSASKSVFRAGHQVGELARQLFDHKSSGVLIDFKNEGIQGALDRTKGLVQECQPVFEAGFSAAGALAFADVLLPLDENRPPRWRMVEVKSSTRVKPYQVDDVAIQAFVARASGLRLQQVSIACVDSSWVYQGDGNYDGLLVETDLTDTALRRDVEVQEWIAQAHAVAGQQVSPDTPVGIQCTKPYPCGFLSHCSQDAPKAEYPVEWLPNSSSKSLSNYIIYNAVRDMRDIPEAMLNDTQRRVRAATIHQREYFDADDARRALSGCALPASFLDFETIQFAVPRWAGTRPFQILPFQFSMHRLDVEQQVSHTDFLDLSGNDPSRAFALALIEASENQDHIFVYNAGFKSMRLRELAQRFQDLAPALQSLRVRLVDLLPIVERHYYHPSQEGNWSIKRILSAMFPQLHSEVLVGFQDDGSALEAYISAVSDPAESDERNEIARRLRRYCALDTAAMALIYMRLSQGALPCLPFVQSLFAEKNVYAKNS